MEENELNINKDDICSFPTQSKKAMQSGHITTQNKKLCTISIIVPLVNYMKHTK